MVTVCDDPAPECCVAIHRSLFFSLYPKKDESQENCNTIAEEAVVLSQALQILGSVSPVESQVSLSLPPIRHLRDVTTMRYALLVFLDMN